ncbi:MAG TPA: hypothetical protein VK942_03285, partial [Actinomycetes bacterium]|nr:hypothetical protein [Actinomycetes bacterium]
PPTPRHDSELGQPPARSVGAWVEFDLGYATVLDPLLLVGRSQADDDVVDGQPHGVKPFRADSAP